MTLRRRFGRGAALFVLAVGLLVASGARGEDVTEPQQRLAALAAKGRADDELLDAFADYVEARAKTAVSAAHLPPDFWTWVARDRDVRRALLLGLHPKYSPKVLTNLQRLRAKFPDAVDRIPQLALAFAFAWSDGPTAGPPRRFWEDADAWQKQGRELPDMETSFG